MKTFKAKYFRTDEPAQITIRGAGGVKLFDACLPAGVSVAIVTQAKPTVSRSKNVDDAR